MSDRALNQVSSLKTRIGRGAAALAVMTTLATALPPAAHADGRWDPGAAAIVGVIGGLALGSALSGGGGRIALWRCGSVRIAWHRSLRLDERALENDKRGDD